MGTAGNTAHSILSLNAICHYGSLLSGTKVLTPGTTFSLVTLLGESPFALTYEQKGSLVHTYHLPPSKPGLDCRVAFGWLLQHTDPLSWMICREVKQIGVLLQSVYSRLSLNRNCTILPKNGNHFSVSALIF